jgi:hypothetical protein
MSQRRKLPEKSIDFAQRTEVKRLSAENVISQFKNQVKRTTPNEKTNQSDHQGASYPRRILPPSASGCLRDSIRAGAESQPRECQADRGQVIRPKCQSSSVGFEASVAASQ